MKKLPKLLLQLLLIIVAGFACLFVIELLFPQDKLKILKNDLIHSYYDEAQLKQIIKEELGDAYEGNIYEDFDNFVISVVLNRLSQYESEKNQRYHSFLSKSKMSKFDEQWQEEASNTEGYSLENDIYYLKINQFYKGETYKRVGAFLPELRKHENLIVDLRDNSGGHLDEVDQVISLFLEPDTPMYSLKTGGNVKHKYASGDETLTFEKIILLVNDNTASASELFVLAIIENLDHVTLLGTKTYGKNISFGLRKFHDHSGMIFINSLLQGAKGTQYGDGIVPDIYQELHVNMKEGIPSKLDNGNKPEGDSDAQLKRAIECIKEY